jgi:hypothetical protein
LTAEGADFRFSWDFFGFDFFGAADLGGAADSAQLSSSAPDMPSELSLRHTCKKKYMKPLASS